MANTTSKPAKAVIWCLFSVDNNYDQPDNNLVAWWLTKPELDVLAKTLTDKPLAELDQDSIVEIVNIWTDAKEGTGKVQRYQYDTFYRLEEVTEGAPPRARRK